MLDMSQRYYRLSKSITDNQLLPIENNPYDQELDMDVDWYTSLYMYNKDHYEEWKKTKSLAGMSGVLTNVIFFDFDDAKDVEKARQDAVEIFLRLSTAGVPQKDIQICFSGKKGFSIKIKTDKEFTPEELKTLTSRLAEGLSTYDKKVYDSQRIIRLIGSRHPGTGLYKIPLTIEELDTASIEDIKKLAADKTIAEDRTLSFGWEEVALPNKIYNLKIPKEKKKTKETAVKDITDLNVTERPKWLPACKYVLQEGFFGEGHRSNAFTILAATYKAQGFHFNMVYRMLKGVAEKQAAIHNEERFPDKEIYNIANHVCSDKWRGGQYTCKTDDLLMEICEGLGENACQHNQNAQEAVYSPREVAALFREYANNIEQNTIKTGLPAIDGHIRMTIGMHIGILAAPGAGKTSALLEILENTSKEGVHSFFFSMDMYGPLIYQKQIQRMTGKTDNEIFDLFKRAQDGNRKAIAELDDIDNRIDEAYKNVRFHFKSGLNVEQIREIVLDYQRTTGNVVKLIGLDYAECISGPYSDAFSNSKVIAHKLKDLATQDNFCVLTLVQPPKVAGDASEPLYSMRQVKGPSDWEQGFSIVLGMYREGYNPRNPETDKFLTITALKNRMGPLYTADCLWDGPTGKISTLFDGSPEEAELEKIRAKKEAAKAKEGFGH